MTTKMLLLYQDPMVQYSVLSKRLGLVEGYLTIDGDGTTAVSHYISTPLILFSFFRIEFARSIRLPTLLFKDYSMRNDIALVSLIFLILTKADTKLLKQQLFNDF